MVIVRNWLLLCTTPAKCWIELEWLNYSIGNRSWCSGEKELAVLIRDVGLDFQFGRRPRVNVWKAPIQVLPCFARRRRRRHTQQTNGKEKSNDPTPNLLEPNPTPFLLLFYWFRVLYLSVHWNVNRFICTLVIIVIFPRILTVVGYIYSSWLSFLSSACQ